MSTPPGASRFHIPTSSPDLRGFGSHKPVSGRSPNVRSKNILPSVPELEGFSDYSPLVDSDATIVLKDEEGKKKDGAVTVSSKLKALLADDQPSKDDEEVYGTDEDPSAPLSIYREVRYIFIRSVPVSVSALCRMVIPIVDSVVIGHISSSSNDYLSAQTLGAMILYMLSVITYGMASTLNTLCSNSIGAGHTKIAGVWLQIALAIIICLCIPILFFCNFVTRPLLQVLSYPEIVIENAVLFTRVASVGFIPQSIFMGMQQYLQAIDVNTPVTIILLIAIPVDIGLNVLLVWGVGSWNGLGFVGSPLASALTDFFILIVSYFYCFVYKKYHVDYWPHFGFSVTKVWKWIRVKEFIILAIPTSLAAALNDYGYEIVLFFAAVDTVAAQGILFSYWCICYSLMFSISVVAQLRIGFFLGAGNPKHAKFTFWVALCMSLLLSIILVAIIMSSDIYPWMSLVFTTDSVTNGYVQGCIYIFSASIFAAMFSDLGFCVMEGVGWPIILIPIMLISSAGILIPMAYIFSKFMSLSLRGIWYASLSSELFKVCIIFPILLFGINWQRASDMAVKRSQGHEEEEDPLFVACLADDESEMEASSNAPADIITPE